MNSKELEAMLAFEEYKTVAKAAEKLEVDRSSVSRRLKKIETELATDLFLTTPEGIVPTYAGQIYLRTARNIIKVYQDMLEDISKDTSTQNIVKIGVENNSSDELISKVIKKIYKTYPKVKFEILQQNNEQLEQSVVEGQLDFAIVNKSASLNHLEDNLIFKDELVLICGLDDEYAEQCCYTKNGNTYINILDLNDKPIIVNKVENKIVEEVFFRTGFIANETIITNDTNITAQLVSEGLGYSLIPKSMVNNKIKYYHIEDDLEPYIYMYIITYNKMFLSNTVTNVIDEIKRTASKNNLNIKDIKKIIKQSMIDEVNTTPKPGLVDLKDTGAHKDMNYQTFYDSADAITDYLYEMAKLGFESEQDVAQVFLQIRQIGLDAEKDMFKATNNVNTHKGMIFSLGLLSCAAGICFKKKNHYDVDYILELSKNMTYDILQKDFDKIDVNNPKTYGEKLYVKYKDKGIRGESQQGYPSIREISYPYMEELHKKYRDTNKINLQVLLKLMSVVNDTNVLHRGGIENLNWLKQRAEEILEIGGAFTQQGMHEIEKFNIECIERNISPGGSADLLAVTIFLYNI